MSKNVFANGMEVSAKKDGNQSICAMPDTCLSPPSPPAGPVPIPYPNTAQASDTSSGSKSVKVGGAEVGLKDSSNYKKSTGDEAATKSLGMGVNTATLSDKLKHTAWSFDVKFEGENAIRHMDLTTHNHINVPTTAGMTCNQASQKAAAGGDLSCQELEQANKDARTKDFQQQGLPAEHALTTAQVRAPGSSTSTFVKGVSSNMNIDPNKTSGYAKPLDKNTTQRPECGGSSPYDPQRKNDSETKILDPLMRLPAGQRVGTTIKMKVYHNDAGGVDCMPCGSCKKSICAAEACGIQITLCNNKNEELRASKLCENGQPQPVDPPNATASQRARLANERRYLWRLAGF